MLTNRSKEKEILDLGPDYYSADEFKHCQKMLFRVNKLLGVFRGIIRTLKSYPKNSRVLDVGCGGGLLLLHLSNYFPEMQFVGTDISADAIQMAENELTNYKQANVTFRLQTHPNLSLAENSFDIILVTMVCHHIADDELVVFLIAMKNIASKAIIINDLQRNFLAEWLFKIFSPLLFHSKIMTHDGLISIRKGFTRNEWQCLLEAAQIRNYRITWRFPFRWEVIILS